MHGAPVHRYLAVADPQEATEIDHRGLRQPGLVHQDIHQAAEVLSLRIGDLSAQDRLRHLGGHPVDRTCRQRIRGRLRRRWRGR